MDGNLVLYGRKNGEVQFEYSQESHGIPAVRRSLLAGLVISVSVRDLTKRFAAVGGIGFTRQDGAKQIVLENIKDRYRDDYLGF
jgi:hypothetical protein